MKNLIYTLFFACISLTVLGQDMTAAQTEFEQGNEAYKVGNYTEALENYQNAKEETQGVAINYNIGNTYFKLNKLPEAILHYERALRYEPANTDALYNLRLANGMIVDRIENLPQSKANIWWKDFRYGLGPDGWAMISIALAFLSVALLLLYYRPVSRNSRRLGFFGGIIGLLLMILTISLAQSADNYRETHITGVVFTNKVDVKSEPREGSTNVFVLHAGTKVNLLEKNSGWYEVKIASGNRGWMKADDLEEI